MTRTEKLAEKIQSIYIKNKSQIDALSTTGPRGGNNARHISGWINLGVSVITRAANKTDMPMMPYWSGSMPTASTAIPACVADEIVSEWRSIFKNIKNIQRERNG